MERVWKHVCHSRFDPSGLDFVHRDDPHPPKRGKVFSRSIGYREVCFQRLWSDLDKSKHDTGHIYNVLRLLFSAPVGPLKKDFFERALTVLKSFPRSKRTSDYSMQYCNRLQPGQIELCIKDVLALMVSNGWLPSHFTCSPVSEYLTDTLGTNRDRLLSRVEFVSATSEQMREEWFEILLSNPVATLNLSVQYDQLSKIDSSVEKCVSRKKMEELIIHLNDANLPVGILCGFTDKLLQSRNLRLLEITSLHPPLFSDGASNTNALVYPIVNFLRQPNFLCLRLYNVVDTSTAKSLILTFLSTPCLSEQSLEMGGLIPGDDMVCCSSSKEQTLPSANEHYHFKNLVLDSVKMVDNETLEMNAGLKIEDVFVCDGGQGSLSTWLFGLKNLMVGRLLLKDYSTNVDHISVPRTVLVGKLTIFVVLPYDCPHTSVWTNSFFTSVVGHPLFLKCTWHLRLKASPSHPFQCCEVIDNLSPILLEHVPLGGLGELSVTVNENIEYLCKQNMVKLMEAVRTMLQLKLDITSAGSSYRTYSDGLTYTHIRF